jgi:broad specificity phosphatase PhoE
MSSHRPRSAYTRRMTTRVFLIRHGSTNLSAEDRFAGETDVALSDLGRDQAGRLSARLAPQKIAAFYASPMSRTIETATLLAAPHRAEVQSRAELREISHGRWEGMTRTEVAARFPEEYGRWESDPFTFAPEGGESGLSVTARALPALLAVVAAHPGEQVAVISHKATIRLILSSLLGFDPRAYRDRLDLDPASLTVLDFKTLQHARLSLYNDTSHHSTDPSSISPVPEHRLSPIWG